MLITHIKNYLVTHSWFKYETRWVKLFYKLIYKLFYRLFYRLFYLACLSPFFLIYAANAQTETMNVSANPSTHLTPAESAPIGNTPEYVIIRSNNQITFSSETAASVAKLFVKEGSHFSTGDVLLELDCRVQQADLSKALAQQKASTLAEKSALKLKKYDSISEFELVKAQADARIADAEVDKLKAIVEKCVIKAPFNGSVSDVMVHDYESVKQGDPLLKIISTENLEFDIQVPSSWLEWLHVGSMVHVNINETHKTVSATVLRINPLIEPISQTVKVIATISPPDTSLLPGMSGQAIFQENPNNIINKNNKNNISNISNKKYNIGKK